MSARRIAPGAAWLGPGAAWLGPGAAWLGLCACTAVGPQYAPRAPDVAQTWSASAPGSGALAAPLERWWTAFEDPLLDTLVERACAANPELELAAARLAEARGALGVARSARLPQVDLGLAYDRSRRSTENLGGGPFFGRRENDLWDAGFDARWELDVFGGLRRGVEAAFADAQALEEAQRAALVSVTAEVARNYVELRLLQQRLATARQRIDLQDETAQIVVLRADAGVASDLDATRARAQVASARSDAPGLEAQVQARIHRLGVLLGVEPSSLAAELAAPAPIPLARLSLAAAQPLEVLARRPDVRQAERACAAASARVGAAVAELYPRLSLGAAFGWLANQSEDLLQSSAVAASLRPGLSLPLFDGGFRRAQVEAASAREEQALAAYRASVLAALEEVENALVGLGAASSARASLREALEEQRQAARFARELYVGGVADFLTVLDAERERFALEDRFLASDGEVALQFVALAKALGGGWSEAHDGERVAAR